MLGELHYLREAFVLFVDSLIANYVEMQASWGRVRELVKNTSNSGIKLYTEV
jgi:hypothetical protein